jgi:hypothetical protein
MAHLQTPPRQSSSARAKAFGLITPSTPVHLSRRNREHQQCPDAPFLPAHYPSLRTSPRFRKGDPIKPSPQARVGTIASDGCTLLQPDMPPTPVETPMQRRQREHEMRRHIEEGENPGGSNRSRTSRRLFPLKPATEDTIFVSADPAPPFEIFTDPMHRTPVSSPNNPFEFDIFSKAAEPRGLSPKKRKFTPQRTLGPHEMWYNFRGKRVIRKVPPGPNGESWRETVKPTRLFQAEIKEAEERQRKRRRIAMEQVDEEIETEEEE